METTALTATTKIINQVYEHFDRSVEAADYSIVSQNDAILWAQRARKRAVKLLSREVSFNETLKLAEDLGRSYSAVSEDNKVQYGYEVRSLLAQAVGRMIAPNRDECRRRSAEEFFRLYGEQLKGKMKRNAAIALTNSALLLLELNNPTEVELSEAEARCQRSLEMRDKGSVDYGYAQLNLSLAKRKNIRHLKKYDIPNAFREVIRGLDRSAKVFKRHGLKKSEYEFEYHHNMIESLQDWLNFEINKVRQERDGDLYQFCSKQASELGISPETYINSLRSNPEVVGCSQPPSWLPEYGEIVAEAVGRVDRLKTRLENTQRYIDRRSGRFPELAIKMFELRACIVGAELVPEIPWGSLEAYWERGDYELYFITANRIVEWCGSGGYPLPEGYPELLSRFLVCINYFRESWHVEDVRRLLERNPTTFRFAACELARQSRWSDAFELLEASRGINSTRTWKIDLSEFESLDEGQTWVHITHSPRASYAIARRGGNYFGREFLGLSGKQLAPEFLNFVTGGLQGKIKGTRASAADSAVRLSSVIATLADWVFENSSDRIVLMEGGFYQGFPVWACGKLGNAFMEGRRKVTSAPSRVLALRNVGQAGCFEQPRSAAFIEASSVPGMAELSFNSLESESLIRGLGPGVEVSELSATPDVLECALAEKDIVHYSGHSVAGQNPLDSTVVTYGGNYSVGSMLGISVNARLVVFASCESGRSLNALHQDEFLSVQSACFYAGARIVIGTNWPVTDLVAFVFARSFYEALSTLLDGCGNRSFESAVSAAFRAAVVSVASFTGNDLDDVLGAGHSFEVPEDFPIFGFYDWASFKLLGIS